MLRTVARAGWLAVILIGLVWPVGPAEAKRKGKNKNKAAEPTPEAMSVLDKSGGGLVMGRLEKGDLTLDSGEFADLHTFEAEVGQVLTLDLYSNDFDTFLIVMSPSGTPSRNDDHEGAKNHSKLDLQADAAGTWAVTVTSYKPGEAGAYTLHIDKGDILAQHPSGEMPLVPGLAKRGRLEAGDPTLESGEFYDLHPMELTAGQSVTVDLRSTAFDTYLTVFSPRQVPHHNDDFEGSKDHSRIALVADETGTWAVGVTSYGPGETGDYEVHVTPGEAQPEAQQVERHSGRLEPGDTTLESGEFVDSYTFEGRQGEFVVVDLRSTEVDPWLEVWSPAGEGFVNDDHEGERSRSQLALTLTETGTYVANVTTYAGGASGAYDLAIHRGGESAPAAGDVVTEQGTLAEGDEKLDSGEFVDTFTFDGRPGQQVYIDLEATAFDGYLVFLTPSGETVHNDDAEGLAGHSVIEAPLSELGTYGVIVTSYRAGESGAYTLTVRVTEGAGYSRQRDAATLIPGTPVSGTLEEGDTNLEGGEFVDIYAFEGTAGQQLTVELTSTAFDPFLGVQLPSGGTPVENDDHEGRRDMSRISFQLQETGRYRVFVTSYGAAENGAYDLSVGLTAGGAAPARSAVAGGRIYGVFVGLGDYPGDEDDLPYTAEDANLLQAAFTRGAGMQPGDSVTLIDSAATMQAIRDAVSEVGARAGADDTFVFFFSGHGARHKRDDTPMTDPDGMDETMMAYDGHINDDEFAALLDGIGAGTTLLILDACFAGGFAKDVISVPGRMGMFSSEEDVTSGVAAKFRAGGYLARFVSDAVGDGLADDGDGGLTALELCQYVHERYRADVKSGGMGDVSGIVLMGRDHGYQHLVVDRGSIGPYQVLFGVKK